MKVKEKEDAFPYRIKLFLQYSVCQKGILYLALQMAINKCTEFRSAFLFFLAFTLLQIVGSVTEVFGQTYPWRKTIDTLCSPSFNGRGYTNNGASLTADFLIERIKAVGLKPINGKYGMQVTEFINTFDSNVNLTIKNVTLKVGIDFLPDPGTQAFDGKFDLFKPELSNLSDDDYLRKWRNKLQDGDYWLLIDTLPKPDLAQLENLLVPYAKGIVRVKKKLTHSFAQEQGKPEIIVLPSVLQFGLKKWQLKMQPHLLAQSIQNVYGVLSNLTDTGKVILITAHYDHLGGIGNQIYFPGANDNASGTAFTLALAQHFANKKEKLPYPIVFVFFGGEEAGLLGSKAFANNPPFPLNRIKFLINLDLLAGGSEGLMMVNGDTETRALESLRNLNSTLQAVPKISSRPNAPNSDHYWFAKKGVPAVFLYTMGGPTAYHDINDAPQNLSFQWFEKVFRLISGFVENYEK